jgi:F-type H+-transporting ATPase subunit delta
VASSSSGATSIALRYATALFDLADESKALDNVADDLKVVEAIMNESADLRRVISAPGLSRDDQRNVMAAVLEKAEVSDLTRRFVSVVAANRRLFVLPQMIKAYLDELARRRGEIVADVTTSMALSDQQRDTLVDQIKQAIGQKVSVNVTVDEDLLGGMIVKIGSRMIDFSLRTKLSKMQLAMKGIG